jgi:hypothetical protein
VSELQRARGRENAAYLWIRALGVAAIAFVVTTSFQARPAPGGDSRALGVAFALTVFCGATIAAMWLTAPRPTVQVAVLLLAAAGAAALIGLQGNGAAFLGVFRRCAWPPSCCRFTSALSWPALRSGWSRRRG